MKRIALAGISLVVLVISSVVAAERSAASMASARPALGSLTSGSARKRRSSSVPTSARAEFHSAQAFPQKLIQGDERSATREGARCLHRSRQRG
jgi:hypothetical protein